MRRVVRLLIRRIASPSFEIQETRGLAVKESE
jgi:hypothetical protein